MNNHKINNYNTNRLRQLEMEVEEEDDNSYAGMISSTKTRKFHSRLPTVGHSTVIRRPNTLRKRQQSNDIIRNHFSSVANLFFFPVLRVLLKGQQNASNWRTVRTPGDELDGLRALLPAHALRALSVFVRCAANSPLHG